jgi:hypothetical protein
LIQVFISIEQVQELTIYLNDFGKPVLIEAQQI